MSDTDPALRALDPRTEAGRTLWGLLVEDWPARYVAEAILAIEDEAIALAAETAPLDVERLADIVSASLGMTMPPIQYKLYEPGVRRSFIDRYQRALAATGRAASDE